MTAFRHLATPKDAAELISFLASEAGGFINGANLPLTGEPISFPLRERQYSIEDHPIDQSE